MNYTFWRRLFLFAILILLAPLFVKGQHSYKIYQGNFDSNVQSDYRLQVQADNDHNRPTVISGTQPSNPIDTSYRYLWIFNDGNYIKSNEPYIDVMNSNLNATPPFPREVYNVPIYNGPFPPPFRLENTTIDNSGGSPPLRNGGGGSNQKEFETIDSFDMNFELFNQEYCPSDTGHIVILSINLPSKMPSFIGKFKLYFNKNIEKNGQPLSEKMGFIFRKELLNRSVNYPIANDNVQNTLSYDDALEIDLSNLARGETHHFFLLFDLPERYKDYVSTRANEFKTEMLATLSLQDVETRKIISLSQYGLSLFNLSTTQASGVLSSGLTQLESSMGNTFISTNNIVNAAFLNPKIVGAHDPNILTLSSCECPELENRHLIYALIEFTNDGTRPVIRDTITVKIELPTEVDFNSVKSRVSLAEIPGLSNSSVDFDDANRTITWKFWAAVGDAGFDTFDINTQNPFARFEFQFLTNVGVALSDIPPMEACTSFGSGTKWCTNKANVRILTTKDKGYNCNDNCKNKCCGHCSMILIIGIISLILLVIILYLVILIYRKHN